MERVAQLLAPALMVAAMQLSAPRPAPVAWPAGDGEEIGRLGRPGHLPVGFEPSGAVWHPGLDLLVLVDDDGHVSLLDEDGELLITWEVDGDLEAVALPDPDGTGVLLGREHPDAVLGFDLATGAFTGEAWDLTPWMTGRDNQGLEALTCVGGLVYAGHQGEGAVYVFELAPGGAVTHLDTLPSPAEQVDLAGLHHDPLTGVIVAVHDLPNLLVEMTVAGDLLRVVHLPGFDQEGVTLVPEVGLPSAGAEPSAGAGLPPDAGAGLTPSAGAVRARVFVAGDGGQLWRYEGYPLARPWPSVGGAAPHALAGLVIRWPCVPGRAPSCVAWLGRSSAVGALRAPPASPRGVPAGVRVGARWVSLSSRLARGVACSELVFTELP